MACQVIYILQACERIEESRVRTLITFGRNIDGLKVLMLRQRTNRGDKLEETSEFDMYRPVFEFFTCVQHASKAANPASHVFRRRSNSAILATLLSFSLE